ncbi:ABC transporter permease subunit [Quadrisphaera sp. KR29]|uniref:ABC transporter permease subunit n=1 Tax=Quadrisphaera sp. KR29 TaxID=3461391 RepID=UPI004043DC39
MSTGTDQSTTTGAGGAVPAARQHRSNHLAGGGSAPSGATLGRAVLAEWTKLRSLRSTWWTLLIALALAIGFAALLAAVVSDPENAQPQGGPGVNGLADPVATALGATGFSALVIGVLGALVASGEYATGSISSSLMALPRRWPLLVAKASVLLAVLVPFTLVLSLSALWIAQVVYGDAATIDWTASETVVAVLGNCAYLVAVALLGLGLGLLLRATAGAITVLVAVVFVAPPLLQLVTWDWVQAIAHRFPDVAAASLQSTLGTGVLSDVAAWLTLLGWAVVPLALGAVVLQRRDA